MTASTFHPSFDPDTGLRITQAFGAAPDAVWGAWTDPELFARWWGGSSVAVSDVALHVGVGGTWQATMALPGGQSLTWSGEYVEVDAPRRLVFTLHDRSRTLRETLELDFAAQGAGTVMTLVQGGGTLEEQEYYAIAEGYRQFFAALADVLA